MIVNDAVRPYRGFAGPNSRRRLRGFAGPNSRRHGFRGFGDETDYYYDSDPSYDPSYDPSGGVDSEGDSIITHEEATPTSSPSSPSTGSTDWLGIGTQIITAVAGATPAVIGLITGKAPVKSGVAGQAAAGTVASIPKKGATVGGSSSSTMLLALGGAAILGLVLLKRK